MKSTTYILDDNGNPIAERDISKWAKWLVTANDGVRAERVNGVRVSTVFLGIDYSFRPDVAPVLWETMVFGGPLNLERELCSGSREQAEAMHARMVERVKNLQ